MAKEQQISKQDELWNKLESDLLTNFPKNYTANIQLIKDILTYKHMVHPSAVVTSYFTIVSGLTAEYFYTELDSSTTLYTVAIAPTGSGKDIAAKVIPDVFKSLNHDYKFPIEDNILTSKITSVSALDKIFKHNRLVIQVIDEFGDALGKMQGGGHAGELTAKYKELYSLTNGTYESGNYARSNLANNIKVTREYPCFILSGITTKTQLLNRLKKEMIHDGFLNRFIILNGTDLKPYSSRQNHISSKKSFEDIFAFHEKVEAYENTTIELSKDAQDYYYETIGDPYYEKSDICKFCEENEEDFETNASISNRWRENSLRLATAITAYEFGVYHTKEEIQDFQQKSSFEKDLTYKLTALNNKEINDEAGKVIEKVREDLIKRKIGSSTDKNLYKAAYEEVEKDPWFRALVANRSFMNEMIPKKEQNQAISNNSNTATPFVKPVYVEKDILEWCYNFIKEQSLKFYDIFHEEVEQSKYALNKSKAINWLKKHHQDSNTWHTLSNLARRSRPFKDIKSNERTTLLKDLVESGILKETKISGETVYQYCSEN